MKHDPELMREVRKMEAQYQDAVEIGDWRLLTAVGVVGLIVWAALSFAYFQSTFGGAP